MNYSELKTAVADWLDHHDSDSQVELFIELARAKINRKLSTMEMTCVATAVGIQNQNDYELPVDWNGAREVSVDGTVVELRGASAFTTSLNRNINVATPMWYTVRAGKIRFSCAPGADATIELAYYRKVPKLVEDTDTNWLLNEHPDCWLYAAVAEGYIYIMDEERASIFENRSYGVLTDIESSDANRRWSGTPGRVIAS